MRMIVSHPRYIFPPMNHNEPQAVINELEISSGMVVADFGCGDGRYTDELRRRVGEKGTVIAFDIDKNVLNAVKKRCLMEADEKSRFVCCDLEDGTFFHPESFDVILLATTLFQINNRERVIQEAARILKKDGLLAIVEWDTVCPFMHKNECVSKEELMDLLSSQGFDDCKPITSVGRYHYGMQARHI